MDGSSCYELEVLSSLSNLYVSCGLEGFFQPNPTYKPNLAHNLKIGSDWVKTRTFMY